MALHKICRQGYGAGSCPDTTPHTDAVVRVVACYAEHAHDKPYFRAAQVLALHGLPVPKHLQTRVVDVELVAGRLEDEAALQPGTVEAEALRYAARVARRLAEPATTP